MNWLEVSIKTDLEAADLLAEALRPYAQGGSVVQEQLGDPHDLDPAALLPDVYLKIYVSELGDTAEFRLQMFAIASRFGAERPLFKPLADIDWAEAWKANYRPFSIGRRFWIRPSWEEPDPREEGKVTLILDPGMAFGTGLHETTQLCLESLETYMQPGMRVLDLGTGSGILALAAAQLGAAVVDALDNDPVAIEASRINAGINGVAAKINLSVGTLADVTRVDYDLVLVNILAAVIMPMLTEGDLLRTAGDRGLFIFSGIIDPQRALFVDALEGAGGEVVRIFQKGDWIAVIGRRKQKHRS